jgi:hypothetical protein
MAITRLGTYSQIKGASLKIPCRVATTADITLSNTTTSIDGVTLATDDRILAWKQSTGSANGIYIFNSIGNWSRSIDMSLNDDVFEGMQVYVSEGAIYSGNTFTLTTTGAITLGSTTLTFVQSGPITNRNDTYTGTAKVTDIITLSQAEYNGIGTKDPSTLYIII